ncbi:hypothetical protein [Pseudomonas azotoformans]|nr:hypothetical protein [Pseudomonas azotoformans]
MLAKIVNDDAVNPENCGALGFFASKLAPTTERFNYRKSLPNKKSRKAL